MKKITKLTLAVSLATCAAGALAVVATASTASNSPGIACIPLSGSYIGNASGQGANPSTTTQTTVVCPIDRPIIPDVANTVSANVWVIDRSTSSDVCCYLESVNPNGGSVKVSERPVCSSGNSATAKKIEMLPVTDTGSFSHFQLNCSLPPATSSGQSVIETYRATLDD